MRENAPRVRKPEAVRGFGGLAGQVVQAKPFNPFVFLIKQLAKHVPDEELQEQGIIIQKEDAT